MTTTQLSLFETSTQISLSDEIVAVNFRGRWEIYSRPEHPTHTGGSTQTARVGGGWLPEYFSHYATPAESLACYFGRSL
jgi:hypothetical protein